MRFSQWFRISSRASVRADDRQIVQDNIELRAELTAALERLTAQLQAVVDKLQEEQ